MGIVTRCQIGASPDGNDLWTVRDAHGDEGDFDATECVVIDADRVRELRESMPTTTRKDG